MRPRFIKSYVDATAERQEIDTGKLQKAYVAYIEDGRYIDWNTLSPAQPVPPVYSAIPLTLEIVQDGTIVFQGYSTWLQNKVISVSRDNGETWETLTPTADGTSINVSSGEKLILKGYNTSYGQSNAFCKFEKSTAHFNIYGNIMSLVDYDNFMALNTLSATYVFASMFRFCKIHNIDVYLPASVLTEGCYYDLFTQYDVNTIEKIKITCLATDITAEDCTRDWLAGVSATGTFVKHPDATWPSGASGIPTGWTVENAVI